MASWSLTIGNGGENHVGMEFLGSKRGKGGGWSCQKLKEAKVMFELLGKHVELFDLNELLPPDLRSKVPPAHFMVVRGFLGEAAHKSLIDELESYEWDAKYFDVRRQKVLNKLARTNVCYGDAHQDPDYENKSLEFFAPMVKKIFARKPYSFI